MSVHADQTVTRGPGDGDALGRARLAARPRWQRGRPPRAPWHWAASSPHKRPPAAARSRQQACGARMGGVQAARGARTLPPLPPLASARPAPYLRSLRPARQYRHPASARLGPPSTRHPASARLGPPGTRHPASARLGQPRTLPQLASARRTPLSTPKKEGRGRINKMNCDTSSLSGVKCPRFDSRNPPRPSADTSGIIGTPRDAAAGAALRCTALHCAALRCTAPRARHGRRSAQPARPGWPARGAHPPTHPPTHARTHQRRHANRHRPPRGGGGGCIQGGARARERARASL
jgi:hypothetical protein